MTEAARKLNTSTHRVDAATLARFCKAAGDVRRLQILRALAKDSYGVLELCRIFAIRQPAMSHHLKVLADAGLVSRRREGNSIFYRRSQHAIGGLEAVLDSLFAAVNALDLEAGQKRRLEAIQKERATASQAFFAANAEKFAEQQELIAAPEQYLDPMLQLIDELGHRQQALELGPGTGWLLPHLAQRAGRLTAVDSSAEMLDNARQFCAGAKLESVQFVHGDSRKLQQLQLGVDLAIVNMVLHHTPSPASVVADLATALLPGGVLLVCELAAHDQTWVKEACGDLWLGFSSEDLAAWALEAGLLDRDSVFLALRNGFQIQLHTFYKPDPQHGSPL